MSDLAWLRPKLAELCGFRAEGAFYWTAGVDVIAAGYVYQIGDWRPDEDVAQAIRVLEAAANKDVFDNFLIEGDGVTLSKREPQNDGPEWVPDKEWKASSPQTANDAWADAIAREICLAIASALNLQLPTETP